MGKLIIAFEEEIGNPDFFIGRKKELDFFLKWASKVKNKGSKSIALLARKKRGKTALVQRLFNTLYTQNDPMAIPFYFRIRETDITKSELSGEFYQTLLSQYFGFFQRDLSLVNGVLPFEALKTCAGKDVKLLLDIQRMEDLLKENNIYQAWEYARSAGHRISIIKEQRIIQIIDEFQFLDRYIFRDPELQVPLKLASSYQNTSESKTSPQIITGSYVGWLSLIIRKMVSRYNSYYLEPLPNDEALDAVYNYAHLNDVKINETTAPYLASTCKNDPYYISQVIESQCPEKNLTTEKGIRDTLDFETEDIGEIGKMWLEYILDAFERINDLNAKKIVLYLAKHDAEVKTREEILKEAGLLSIDDKKLEDELKKLVKADVIAGAGSSIHFKGLGDPIFEMVFRKYYEAEIDNTPQETIKSNLEIKLIQAQKRISYYKGMSAEYRVKYWIYVAGQKKIPLEKFVYNPQPGVKLAPFSSIQKRRVYLDQEKSLEIDLYAESEDPNGTDWLIEVKDWKDTISTNQLDDFIQKKELLEKTTDFEDKKAAFLIYSENGFNEKQKNLLEEKGIMYTDSQKFRELL